VGNLLGFVFLLIIKEPYGSGNILGEPGDSEIILEPLHSKKNPCNLCSSLNTEPVFSKLNTKSTIF
jgi:hypothetical protein